MRSNQILKMSYKYQVMSIFVSIAKASRPFSKIRVGSCNLAMNAYQLSFVSILIVNLYYVPSHRYHGNSCIPKEEKIQKQGKATQGGRAI